MISFVLTKKEARILDLSIFSCSANLVHTVSVQQCIAMNACVLVEGDATEAIYILTWS